MQRRIFLNGDMNKSRRKAQRNYHGHERKKERACGCVRMLQFALLLLLQQLLRLPSSD